MLDRIEVFCLQLARAWRLYRAGLKYSWRNCWDKARAMCGFAR